MIRTCIMSDHLSLILGLLLVAVLIHQSCSKSLPLCGRTEINNGRWVNSSAPYNVTWSYHQFLDYFVHGGPGEGLNFTQVWLPHGCSYHRWNNHTFQSCAKHVQLKRNESSHEQLRIAFIGDSATRGVFNGLTRLLSGSELYGPCNNVVCGGPGLPVSYRQHLQIFRVPFPPAVELIFMYFKSMTDPHAVSAIKNVLRLKPYVTIFNSGAWDFDHLSRKNGQRAPIEQCDNEEYEEIAKMRASPEIRTKMLEISAFATEMGSKLIYRTNHYNVRYGANCADDRVLEMIRMDDVLRTSWEIWDNFNASRDSWYVSRLHSSDLQIMVSCLVIGWNKPTMAFILIEIEYIMWIMREAISSSV